MTHSAEVQDLVHACRHFEATIMSKELDGPRLREADGRLRRALHAFNDIPREATPPRMPAQGPP